MSYRFSELVEISKLNGDFKRNYGRLLGAYLYLRSVSAARGRSIIWTSVLIAIVADWLKQHGGVPWLW
jgi:hypothetical protein